MKKAEVDSNPLQAPEAVAGAAPAGDTVSFSEAMRSLEAILKRVETEEIDIDDLAAELRRASELLETARSKISRAELEVTQIVARLDAEVARDGDG